MNCPTCGKPNPPGARFCGSCATALDALGECPRCGASNPSGQRFCNGCAHPLGAAEDHPAAGASALRPRTPEHIAEKIRSSRASLEGERKQVTVLFADIVGSMELAEQTDPERWRAILDRFFGILADGVHRFEGTVDKFTGDGIMAIFGAPVSHEDHARRACYAALHLHRDLADYATDVRRADGLSISARIGLNSGEVVVGAIGDEGSMAYTAVGHTVGLAQRMEQLAAPDRIYLSEHTASLAEGYFTLEDLGSFEVKGAGEPLRVFELTGVGPARGAIDVARARGLTRFVGRADELRTLLDSLQQAISGRGQVVGIVGEAGVGKSRLCHELAEGCRARGIPVYHLAGQAHAASVPLMPLLRFLREYFEIGERDSAQRARERIAGKLLLLDPALEEELPLLFDFLAVPDPERPVERMDPEARQRRLLKLMRRLTYAQNAREPGLTVIEDLHWLDSASEVFLASHVEAVQGTRGLTLVNFRPEYQAPWMSRSYYRQIALAPLGEEAIEELLADLLGSDPSLDGLDELIRQRTQGNPFFVEELVCSLVEAGTLLGERGAYRLAAQPDEASIPATVQAVLAARIDRLDERDKSVLQAAAVIGKEFSSPILRRVADLPAAELEHTLRTLVAGEFVYEQEPYPEPIYAFRHPLTQDVAYRSQLTERRTQFHAAAARAVADQHPERLDEHAALIAGHWESAGEELDAARWHARAAAWSEHSDPAGALRHWTKVRDLADALPASPETIGLGLTARIYSLHLGFRVGVSLEEAEALFTEGERIALKAGDVRSRTLLLATYGDFRSNAYGQVHEQAELTRQAAVLAEEAGDPALYMAAIPLGTYPLHILGEYGEGLAFLDRAIELAGGDPAVGADMLSGCPYAFCHMLKGMYLVTMGELERAARFLEQGMEVAREHRDLRVTCWSHDIFVWLAYFSGERETALAHGRQAVEIAERIGDAYSRSGAWTFLGIAERMRGEWEQAIEALERSLAIAEEHHTAAGGVQITRVWALAESCIGAGDMKRAQAAVEELFELARSIGGPFVHLIASWTQGRVLLASPGPTAREIEVALARALELARASESKAIEPLIHAELAELARRLDDERRREQELREAYRLSTEIGATGHAERLAAELAAAAR